MRLPSLNALRAFEAAARHESFARAAHELCVTEGAISRHIKVLEDELGVVLFHRLTRKVELSDEGKRLLPVLGEAFAAIASGVARVSAGRHDLKVISAHTLSLRWLVPRLEKFRALNPGFGVDLTTKFYSWDEFVSRDFDVGFACTLAAMPKGINAVRFIEVALTPACAPRLVAENAMVKVTDLAAVNLLHSSEDHYDWAHWAGKFGGSDFVVARGQVYPNRDMAAQAAVMGEGVAIADMSLMKSEFDSGRLVAPFPAMIYGSPEDDYSFICRDALRNDSRVRVFYDWLVQERDAT
jgi:LysR family glycine cleavage system transcriptional activator